MKLWDVVKKVGAGIVRNVVPGGGLIVDTVNDFLPDDKKLPKEATGEQVRGAVESLPPETRSRVMEKELDVEIEEIRSWTSIQDSLAKADAAGASTRPEIAKLMAYGVFIAVMTFMAAWASAIFGEDEQVLTQLADSWEIMLAVLATPTALLRAYFGMRTKEKKARYSAAAGQPVSPINQIIGAFKK